MAKPDRFNEMKNIRNAKKRNAQKSFELFSILGNRESDLASGEFGSINQPFHSNL